MLPPEGPPVPPPPPPVAIRKPDPQREKLIQRFGVFDGSREDELQSKHGRIEDKNPSYMSEAEGTGIVENPEIDKTNKSLCERCEKWIPLDMTQQHYISHSSQILPWMYLGGQNNAYNLIELTKRTNISYILNVAKEIINFYPKEFTYLHMEIRDEMDEDISFHFDQAFEFIDKCKQEGKNILIHCMLGMSRSASMVLMYLMRGEKMTLREAWDLTKRARYIILPNPFFARVLVHYEKQLFGKNTMTYVEVNKLCLQMYE